MAKRLLFLDFLRGIAILVLIVIHVLIHGVWYFPEIALEVVSPVVLVMLSPLVIFATWAGLFAIISGFASSYNLYEHVVVREKPFWKAAKIRLFNSTTVLIGHLIYVTLTAHVRNTPYPEVSGDPNAIVRTGIAGSAETLSLYPPDWIFFFFADAIGMIALSGYLSVLILWIVWKINGKDNHSRNYKSILIIALIWLAISIPIWNAGYGVVVSLLKDGSFLALVAAKPLSWFVGAFQPMFPLAGFTFMGVVLGILLADQYRREDPETDYDSNLPDIREFLKKFAMIFLVIFAISLSYDMFIRQIEIISILEYKVIPYTLFTLNMSLMLLSILVLLNWFEFKDHESRLIAAKRTIWIRRFGLVSLSVYLTESVVNGFFSSIFHRVFDDPSTPEDEFFTHAPGIALFAIIVPVFWIIFLKFWEKSGFKYGAEWWIVQIGAKFREKKSSRLDLGYVLYNPLKEPPSQPTTGVMSSSNTTSN